MESGSREDSPWKPRSKSGLETPLVGRFIGENRKLVFAPPRWYDVLVISCLVLGAALFLGILDGRSMFFLPVGRTWSVWVGAALLGAGAWALLSNERMACDLRSRTYSRLEGAGVVKRFRRGSLAYLDALVLSAEERPLGAIGLRQVTYRLVLHWKGAREPLLVIGRVDRTLTANVPLNSAAGEMLALGARYAKELQVPFYDNAYFSSSSPLKPV